MLVIFGLIFTPPVITGHTTLQQADSTMIAGDFAVAAELYVHAVGLLPWRVDLWEQAGTASFFSGNFQEAIRFFEQGREKGSLSAHGWEWLGQAYWSTHELEAAEEVWSAGLEAHPVYARFYYYLSMVYLQQKNLPAEQQALELWVASGGREVSGASYYRLGQLLSLSEPKRATEHFLLAASLDPMYDPAVQTMLATLDLASLESDESRRLVLIGRGLGLVDEWQSAADAFRQAVAADGRHAEAWAWLGESKQQIGEDGRSELDSALKFGPTNPVVRSLRGLYWTRLGDGERALLEYQAAAEYDPENPNWLISIGDAYVQSGDLLAALESYTRATEIAPANAMVWRLLAVFSTQYNVQVEEIGLPAAQMAVELSGEDPLALDALGWALTLLERYNEAQDVLEHAVALDPTLALGHLHLGVIALQLEEWETALMYLNQARELAGDGPVGERAQVLLNQYFP